MSKDHEIPQLKGGSWEVKKQAAVRLKAALEAHPFLKHLQELSNNESLPANRDIFGRKESPHFRVIIAPKDSTYHVVALPFVVADVSRILGSPQEEFDYPYSSRH